MNYELKYIKYKNKYIELKNQIGGKLTDIKIKKLFFDAGIEDHYKNFILLKNFNNYIKIHNETDIKNMIKYIAFILLNNQNITHEPSKIFNLADKLQKATYIAVSLNIYWDNKDIEEIKILALDIYNKYCIKDIIQDAYIIEIFKKYQINNEIIQNICLKSLKKTKLLELSNILKLYIKIIEIQTLYIKNVPHTEYNKVITSK